MGGERAKTCVFDMAQNPLVLGVSHSCSTIKVVRNPYTIVTTVNLTTEIERCSVTETG